MNTNRFAAEEEELLVLPPGRGRTLVISPGGTQLVFKARGERAGAAFALAELTAEPHWAGPVPHVHRRHEELWYVLEGEFEFLLGEERVHAGPGTFVRVPPGLVHAPSNALGSRSRLIMTLSPPDFEGYFHETAAAAERIRSGETTDEIEALKTEIRARYDTYEVTGIS
jgi:mannose-6-phosphate isomerase-like protein (cupin superfamily)